MTESDSTALDQPAQASPTPASERAKWDSLGLSAETLEQVRQAGFEYPTPVQAESIPVALAKRDLVASAQTGTGKTASFVLPMVERFIGRQGTFGLILSPTREIAQQTAATLELFGTPRGVRSIVLIGGINMRQDDLAIASYPQIIVATPGRLCDHLDRGNIWLDFIEMVVLDEADRMLDMGFAAQLGRIMEDVPSSRQTLLYSATIPPSVDALARKILRDPARVAIGKPLSAAKSVDQKVLYLKEEAKNRELIRMIRREPGSMIVFVRSKDGATRVWRSLHSAGMYEATYIHSDRTQAHREQALAEFKEGKYRVLIATDVAGRGIHVDAVAHVVNYDLPLEPEDYVHRIGRTGRAGETGKATSFITARDRRLLVQIERLLGRKIDAENEPAPRTDGDHSDRGDRPQRGDRPDRGGRREHRGDRGPRPGGDKSRDRGSPRPPQQQSQSQPPQQQQAQGPKPVRPPGGNPAPLRASDFFYGDEPSGKPPAPSNSSTAPEDRVASDGGPKRPRRRRRRGGRGGQGGSGGNSSGGGNHGRD